MVSILSILLLLGHASSFFGGFVDNSRKMMKNKRVNPEGLTNLTHSVRSSRIDPSLVVQLLWRPRVFVYEGFISYEECDYLISLAQQKRGEISSLDSDTKGPTKRSEFPLDMDDDLLSRIEEKISAWTLLPQENSRPLKLMHYGHEEAKQRYDYFGNKSAFESGGLPLMATVIIFLSNVSRGGDILFSNSELKDSGLKKKVWFYPSKGSSSDLLRPIKGNALLFFNVHPKCLPDKSSSHERFAVLQGELWCAAKFFHLRAVDEDEVPSESDTSECTDEDDSCPQWAALGECHRNPVFMVGSPDYYGTCRKSCKVC
ncbi:hypothetical protein Nepgr_029964 [Nepenthes gracilis]|uniref:procollagen-proline 4-dioxygenase n=1 Tax=Nepenthes gracilis TaxID=150966 RepID=A0AAD3TFB9_NEPGR|nr:hypothetical protein Nepgr_029964 [Nepenthes gracilis]